MKPRMTKRYKVYEVYVWHGDSGWRYETMFSIKREADRCCAAFIKAGHTACVHKFEIPPVEIVE